MSNTFKKTFVTTYEWWRVDSKDDVREEDEEELIQCADERIKEMIPLGAICGELQADIFKDSEFDETIPYKGYWEVKEIS